MTVHCAMPIKDHWAPSRAEFTGTEKICRACQKAQKAQSSGFGLKKKNDRVSLVWHGIPRHTPITPPYLSHQVFTGSHAWAELHPISLLRRLNYQMFNKTSGEKKSGFCWVKVKQCRKQNLKKEKTASTSSDYLELYVFIVIYNWQKVARIRSSQLS